MSAEPPPFGGHRQPLQQKTFADDRCGTFDIVGTMSRGKEPGFELRRRKINAAIETGLEEPREFFRIASFRTGQIGHWFRGEKETEHGTNAVKNPREL